MYIISFYISEYGMLHSNHTKVWSEKSTQCDAHVSFKLKICVLHSEESLKFAHFDKADTETRSKYLCNLQLQVVDRFSVALVLS